MRIGEVQQRACRILGDGGGSPVNVGYEVDVLRHDLGIDFFNLLGDHFLEQPVPIPGFVFQAVVRDFERLDELEISGRVADAYDVLDADVGSGIELCRHHLAVGEDGDIRVAPRASG